MSSKIYEYAVIYNPSEQALENDKTLKPALIVDVTRVLAKSDQEVEIQASRAIPDAYLDKLDQVEIAIRPF